MIPLTFSSPDSYLIVACSLLAFPWVDHHLYQYFESTTLIKRYYEHLLIAILSIYCRIVSEALRLDCSFIIRFNFDDWSS